MKKYFNKALLFLLAPGALLAEGESQASNWDFSVIGTEVQTMSTQYKAFFTTYLIPAAVTIIACGVVLYLLNRAPRSTGLGKK